MLSSLRKEYASSLIFVGLTVLMQMVANPATGQVSITSASAVTQNFNSIGSSGTATLPTGFRVSNGTTTAYSSGTNATTLAAGTSGAGALGGTSSGGIYNFADGVTASSTDRAIGFITTGSFSSPGYLYAQLQNNTGSTITALTITFDYEKYRAGTRAWDMAFQTSTDGASWGTAISGGAQAYASDAANAVVNPPTSTSKSVTISGLTITNGSFYYLRWSFTGSGGSTNAQGIGVDNISITPTLMATCTTPTAYSVTPTGTTGYCSGGSGVTIGLANSQTSVNYQLYTGAATVGSPVAGTGSAISFGSKTTAATYTVLATSATGSCTAAMTGSATVAINALPTVYTVTGTGSYCAGGSGVAVGLGGSQTGVNYQLYNGATTVGGPVAGTGSAISFGNQTTAATYSVLATNATTGCTRSMSGSAVVSIIALPTVYSVTGTGSYCAGGAGVAVGLANSQTGVNYQLYNGASTVGSPVAGTGAAISFGSKTMAATYTVVATAATGGCSANMSGSAIVSIDALPQVYSVTGTGSYCAGGAGVDVGLNNSETGVTYQLYDGSSTVGSPVAGTGSAISFGLQTTAATYSVSATSDAGCASDMDGSAAVSINFLPTATISGTTTIFIGGSATLTFTGVENDTVYYTDGTTTNSVIIGATGDATVNVTPSSTTTYSITTAVSAAGCSNTITGESATVTVSSSPVASISGEGAICAGVSTDLVFNGTAGATVYYNDGTATPLSVILSGTAGTGSYTLTVTPSVTTTYTLDSIVSGSFHGTLSDAATVTVNPLPVAYSVTGAGAYCTGSTDAVAGLSGSETGVDYQLYNGAEAIGSSVSGTGSAISFGNQTLAATYSVLATSGAGCTSSMSGSAAISFNALPAVYAVTGSGSACAGTEGVAVGLSNSEEGIAYQLYNGASAVGSPVAGTGSAISFGNQTISGTYTVMGVNTTTGCMSNMSGSASVTIYAVPAVYTVTGTGSYCSGGAGVAVGLSASQSGVTYQLYNGAATVGSAVSGTGAAISFGSKTLAATYSVTATGTGGCTAAMSGDATVSINALPQVYSVTGTGSYCAGGAGVAVGLTNSETAVNYQLYTGATAIGSALSGTGSAISFGSKTTAATYTVQATNATTGCVRNMSGSAVVTITSAPSAGTLSGTLSILVGGTTTLSSTVTGGTWTSANTSVATIGSSSGTVTGAGAGTAIISYTTTNSCASTTATTTVTVSLVPVTLVAFNNTWSGTPTTVNATTVATNIVEPVTASRGSSLTASSSSARFSASGWPSGSTLSLSGNNAYMTFTVTAESGYLLNLNNSTLSFSLGSSGSGPATYGIYTSVGGFTSTANQVGGNLTTSSTSVTFPSSGYNGLSTIQIRLYGWNASASGGTGGFASMSLNGNVVPNCTAPTAYSVTPTGTNSYCSGGTGVVIGLSNSQSGVSYQLYNGAATSGSAVSGTGSAISFGAKTATGTYTVRATSGVCTTAMTGSTIVSINATPTVYTVTGTGSYCAGGTGVAVGLGNSQTGVNYQLYNGATTVGSPVAGTGSSISFGNQTTAATYSVLATNATTGCTRSMSSSAVVSIIALPTVYSVTGTGSYCVGGAGVAVGLGSSQTGVNYQLYDGTSTVGSPVAGTGAAISFGNQTTATTYTVAATTVTGGCISNMSGGAEVSINPLPVGYAVTGTGSYCAEGAGVAIGLENSETGVDYQLYNGSSTVGSPVAGTGSAISFGLQTTAATYTATATNTTTGCTSNMDGGATITINSLSTATISGTTTIFIGGSATLTFTGSENDTVYYTDGTTTSLVTIDATGETTVSVTPSATTTYSITTVVSAAGCANAITGQDATVTVSTTPVASISGNTTICAGISTDLVFNGTAGATVYYNDGTATPLSVTLSGTAGTGSYTLTVTPSTTTTYTLDSIVSGSFHGTLSDAATVTVNPLPVAYAVTGAGTYCTGSTDAVAGLSGSETGVDYQLYNGAATIGSPVSGTGSAISFGNQTLAATYSVLATSGAGCTSSMSGSAAISFNALPAVYAVTGTGSACAGTAGVAVGLSNSEEGIAYQLYNGASAVGSPVPGTGSAISFGNQTISGTYTVAGVNTTTGCMSNMSSSASVTIYAVPVVYTVTGTGSYCAGGAGVAVGLSASQSGVTYQLYNGAATVGSTVSGTGAAISFGSKTLAATYSVTATGAGGCTAAMSGDATVSINALPQVYSVTGTGSYCAGGAGVAVGLTNSETAVNYQLYTGATAIGSAVSGTGSAISFGSKTTAATYTVQATNTTTGCVRNMSGSAVVTITSAPSAGTLSGTLSILVGGTTTLGSTVTGGTWTSANTSVATIGSSSGTVTGAGAGTAIISYTTTNSCASTTATTTVTVSLVPVTLVAFNNTWSGTPTTVNATTVAANIVEPVTASRGSSLTASSSSARFSASGWPSGSTLTLSGNNAYMTFTVTAESGYLLNLNNSTLSFSLGSSGSGPATYGIYTSVGGFTSTANQVGGNLTTSSTSVTFPSTGYNGLSTIQIRLYGWNASASGGTGGFASMSLNGNVVPNCTAPTAYSVTPTGTNSYCSGGTGVVIGLSNSQSGVSYQLYNGAAVSGSAVAGTGSAISFGAKTATGTYTVRATSGVCTTGMTGSTIVSINATPTVYTITGTGGYCAGGLGRAVGLNNSQTGVNYQLYNGATTVGSPVAGTNSAISFGNQTTAATYSVLAISASNGCTRNMNGSAVISINTPPAAFAVTGGGTFCGGGAGMAVGLDNSETGVNYRLYNGGTAIGSQVAGTGAAISFGNQTLAATYTVTGTNAVSGCVTNMSGSADVISETFPNAGTISGAASVCTGASVSLSNTVTGGTWLSSDTSIAVIDTDGMAAGASGILNDTAIEIMYIVTNTCGADTSNAAFTIHALPFAGSIAAGDGQVCIGAQHVYIGSVPGGAWSVGDESIAGVDAAGAVTGISAGTATIYYTVTDGNGCSGTTSASIIVNPLPEVPAITAGTGTVCVGSTLTLVNSAGAGSYTWTSSDNTIATVNPVTGVVSGVSAGTVAISYIYTDGCTGYSATIVTVNPITSLTVTGIARVCAFGDTTLLEGMPAGGTWSSSNILRATVGSASGIVTGANSGTARITYLYTNEHSCTSTAITIVTTNILPVVAVIGGVSSVCAGSTSVLTNGTTGGVWTSANTDIATVGTSGIVSGILAGTATVSYTVTGSNGCSKTNRITVTVNPLPSVSDIDAGSGIVCPGATLTLSDTTITGGTRMWTSGDPSVATVNRITGVVTGVATGTASISYNFTSGCTGRSIAVVSVNPVVIPTVSPTLVLCAGTTATLTATPSGGTWASTVVTKATVGSSSGIVTGITGGTAAVQYSYVNELGCVGRSYTAVTVNGYPALAVIAGANNVCANATTLLTSATTGGAWASSDPGIATVDASGLVSGVAPGTVLISYSVTSADGCIKTRTKSLIVNAVPTVSAISAGAGEVCSGSTLALSNATTGTHSWISGSTDIATVNPSTGLVTGISAGTVTISYRYTNVCTNYATTVIAVNPVTTPTITGTASLCVGGNTTTLTGDPAGGTWSSSSASMATVGSTGIVTSGASAGVPAITYAYTNEFGCNGMANTAVTVNALPTVAAIGGPGSLCANAAITLTEATSGGVWTGSNEAIATIGSTRVVSGVAPGTVTISYTVTGSNGCSKTNIKTLTVNAVPSVPAIEAGSGVICPAATLALSSATTGGTYSWVSSAPSVATVNSATGLVTGIAGGTAVISYSYTLGCTNTVSAIVTVNPATTPTVTGTSAVCANGGTTELSAIPAGGAWSSSATAKATVGTTGLVTGGASSGTVTISYLFTNEFGCSSIKKATVTVNALPSVSAISGASGVCIGATASLVDPTSGGVWTSGNTDVATVGTGGTVTGVAEGVVTITYTVTATTGCSNTSVKTITVNPLPSVAAIEEGDRDMCPAAGITLTNSSVTGTHAWTSNNPSVATVNAGTGVVTGVTAGTALISYNYTLGCTNRVATVVTVNSVTTPTITGTASLCVSGGTTSLTAIPEGGTWVSSSPSRATISSAGFVTAGVSSGIALMNYSYINEYGCNSLATLPVTVNALPSVANIGGISNVCVGSFITLTNTTTGGVWAAGSTGIAEVGSAGTVTGISAGTVTVSYTVAAATGCSNTVTKTVTVNALPYVAGIDAGSGNVCPGVTLALYDATAGDHSWTSSTPSVATVNASTGIVTGIAPGVTVISYNYRLGCINRAMTTITVNPVASVAATTGPATVALAGTITLENATSGGVWSSSNPSVATVGSASGEVTGASAGAANITYTITGCGTASAVHSVSVTASRPEQAMPEQEIFAVSVYPNPTAGSFTVNTNEPGVFIIYSLDGKELKQYAVGAGINGVSMPEGTAAGIYMCRFSGVNGKSIMVRLVYNP